MTKYRIEFTRDAVTDLNELLNYIAFELLVPETALSYVQEIENAISSLASLPGRIKPISEEPWFSRGVRRLQVNNFYVYYQIDDDAGQVTILNVIYAKRDQLNALGR